MDAFVDEQSEMVRLRATLDITNALLSAVSSTNPIEALTTRISTLCHGSAIIYDSEGTIVASTGEAPVQLIWNEVNATHLRALELQIGRWHVRTRRVGLQNGVHVIAIASRGLDSVEQLGELLLDTSERLLGAVHGIQYGATQRDRRDNEHLIATLHDGVLPAREHRFWSRLAQFQFPAYAPILALELAPITGGSATEAQLDQLISRARSDAVPLLIMLRRADMDTPATIAAIIPSSDASQRWISHSSKHFLVGVSAPSSALSRVGDSIREAETGLSIARQWASAATAPGELGAVQIDRIDLSTWLLSHVDKRQLGPRVERTISALSSPQLRETLTTYLAADQNIGQTADALFIHPNTIRYRLAKIEEAIGQPVTSTFALSNFILALYPEIMGRRAELLAARNQTRDTIPTIP